MSIRTGPARTGPRRPGCTVVRAHLPTPDAAIIRDPDGSVTIVADTSLPESYIRQLVAEAPARAAGDPLTWVAPSASIAGELPGRRSADPAYPGFDQPIQ